MRFLLDNDVDVAVRRVLIHANYECWTAFEAGLAGREAAVDDELSVYAREKSAVVVTHDREFSQRRIDNTFGKHLWLRCEQPDAAALVAAHLEEVVEALNAHGSVVFEPSTHGGVVVHPPTWR